MLAYRIVTVTMIRYRPHFDTERLAKDMALRGWNVDALAKAAGVSGNTVRRFLANQIQTAKTAERLSRALGHPVKRYFVRVEALAS